MLHFIGVLYYIFCVVTSQSQAGQNTAGGAVKLAVDISMYPLRDEYVPPIEEFISILSEWPDLSLLPQRHSTIVSGDFEIVMDALSDAMQQSFRDYGKLVFVTKFIPE